MPARSFAGRRIELASDVPTPEQMCRVLSDALIRPLRYRETQMAAMREFLRGRVLAL